MNKKSHLFWSVKDPHKLSDEAVAESVFNYGNWDDFLFLEKEKGTTKLKEIFTDLAGKKRSNLRPPAINFFRNYFAKYA